MIRGDDLHIAAENKPMIEVDQYSKLVLNETSPSTLDKEIDLYRST